MKIYRVKEQNYGTTYGVEDYGVEIYFSTFEKARHYCYSKGLYQKQCNDPYWLSSPLARRSMVEHGNFLIDVTGTWLKSEKYRYTEIWRLESDYMLIEEIEVL